GTRPGHRARSPSRDRPCVPESRTDDRSADRASAPPAPAAKETGTLCACRCARSPATLARQSESGSSLACQNIQDAGKGFAVDLIVDAYATAVRELNFDPSGIKRRSARRHGRRRAFRGSGIVSDFNRQKGQRPTTASHPESASPAIHQRAINIVAACYLRHRHPGLQRLRDDLLLQRIRPVPAPISAAQNLHPMNGHVAILAACIVAIESTTKTARHRLANKAALIGSVRYRDVAL